MFVFVFKAMVLFIVVHMGLNLLVSFSNRRRALYALYSYNADVIKEDHNGKRCLNFDNIGPLSDYIFRPWDFGFSNLVEEGTLKLIKEYL